MKLVDDWKRAHKWASVQIAGALGVVSLAYDYFPAVQAYIAPYVSPKAMAALSALIIIARITVFRKKP